MAAQTIEIDVVINGINNMNSGMASATSSVDKFSQSVQKTQKEVDRLGGTNAKPTVSVVDRASSTLSKITNAASSFTRKTWQAVVKVKDLALSPLKRIKNALFSIKSLVLTIGAGWAANKLFSQPISLADSYSSAKIGFSTLLGDAEGQKMMDKIDQFAKETPFKTSGVINNVQKMMAMGWNPKDVIKDMETIGDAAAATGKGDEGLASITYALSEIRSKGKLSTQELNQLASAGIKAKAYLAEGLGYGTSDKGMKKLAADLEDGAIGAEKAIELIMKGMEEFDGMMDRTANETVDGLKSQIEDAFEINVFRRWGQGLQDGAKRGFGSIVELLDQSEAGLKKFGDTVYDIGKELSNWAADKLEVSIDKLMKLMNTREFKSASLGGKIKLIWDEIIAEPLGDWWDTKGKAFVEKKFGDFGEVLGRGVTNGVQAIGKGILALLGVDTSGMDIFNDASDVGSNFAKGFTRGFDGKKVMGTIKQVFVSGFKSLFSGNWLSNIILGYLTVKLSSGILSGISKARGLWYGAGAGADIAGTAGIGYAGGLKGFLGGASTASGSLVGSGAIGTLAKIGSAAGSTAYTGGGLALAGLGTVAGTALGVAGTVKGGYNVYKAVNAETSDDKKHYGWRAGTSLGAVGIGALIGTAVAPGVGTAVGAGIGGLAALIAGNKVADSISGVKKTTEQLRQEAEKLKDVNMAKHFGEWEMSATELEKQVKKIIGADTITRVEKFNTSLDNLYTAEEAVSSYKDDISYFGARVTAGEKLSASDIDEYSAALSGYSSSLKEYLNLDKKNTRSAFQLLYGDDTKGLQKMTSGINKTYTKLEKDLNKKTDKLNKIIGKAFKDGKITKIEEKEIEKILNQIEEIEEKIKQKTEKAEQSASYDLIKKKYSVGDMSVDSYKKLLAELNSQNETDLKAADDAYITAKAKIDLQFEDGSLTKKQYENKLKELEENYLNTKGEPIKRTVEISFEILQDNYSSLFKKLESTKVASVLTGDSILSNWDKNYKNHTMNIQKLKATEKKDKWHRGADGVNRLIKGSVWTDKTKTAFADLQNSFLSSIGADEKVQVQMAKYYDQLKPQEKQLKSLKKSYEELGEEVPEWINEGLANIDKVKLMSGDLDTFYQMIGEQLAKTDKEYAEKLKNSSEVPQALKEGIEKGLKTEASEPIEYVTNLEVTTDKDKIDTSKLDKKTKEVVETLEEEGILKITKNGEVSIKTKDGKIDTSGLDEKTKEAIQELEEKGILVVKDGKVTVKASEVDTSKAEEGMKNKVTSTFGTPYATPAYVDVLAQHNSTDTSAAKTGSNGVVQSAFATPFSTSSSVNVSTSMGSVTGLGSILSGLKAKMSAMFGTVNTTSLVNIKARRFGGANSSQKEGHNAYGSRVDSEILTWVGENNNREYIIPVSSAKRQRGLDLWMQAGKDLGVMNNANGGVYGSSGGSSIGRWMTEINGSSSVSDTESKHNTSGSVEVNVGGITIEIKGSGNGASADIESNKDMICSTIATALEEAFQNLPLATT